MNTDKAQLRAQLRQTRLEMLNEEHRLNSQAIVGRLKQAIDWAAVQSLHYFEPLQQLAEPDINGFITYLKDTYPALQLSTPRLINGSWEVVNAHGGSPPDQFDAVLVPMLGFDPRTLHRLGYGGGYYDKFLATQPQARKIGVCFEAGKLTRLPSTPQDIPLNLIITDQATY
jgi:5-formyltetrahydrofolate cyclo-ligase